MELGAASTHLCETSTGNFQYLHTGDDEPSKSTSVGVIVWLNGNDERLSNGGTPSYWLFFVKTGVFRACHIIHRFFVYPRNGWVPLGTFKIWHANCVIICNKGHVSRQELTDWGLFYRLYLVGHCCRDLLPVWATMLDTLGLNIS